MNKRLVLYAMAAVLIAMSFVGTAQAAVVLNETYSRGTDAAPDWVELYNHSNVAVDISGYKVYDNGGQSGSKPKMAIPAGTMIMPYGFFVIATDDKSNPANFGLGSGGDKVWLENSAGAVIDSSEFGAMQPTQSWQRIPDGAALWKMSTPLTRGTTNVVVKLNETYSRGTDAEPDWVELYNNTADTVDISGYKIYDNGGQSGSKPKKMVPTGTMVMPNGFYIVVVDDKSDPANFGLGSGGDKVWLEDINGVLVDSVEFGALTQTQSYSRIPDAGNWQVSDFVTKGIANKATDTSVETDLALVQEFRLEQNYPNPFNPSTQISFVLPRSAEVQIAVYNLAGQMVAELANGKMAAGEHQLRFDGKSLASGIYLYTIRSADFTASKRMALIK